MNEFDAPVVPPVPPAPARAPIPPGLLGWTTFVAALSQAEF